MVVFIAHPEPGQIATDTHHQEVILEAAQKSGTAKMVVDSLTLMPVE